MADEVFSQNRWDVLSLMEGLGPFTSPQESHCVVRIPVSGPGDYNTLVVVRGFGPLGKPHRDADKIKRDHFVIPSNFVLNAENLAVRAPVYEHSTAAALSNMWSSTDFAFTYGIDEVGGYFSDRGRWMVVVDTAMKGAAASSPFEAQSALFGWLHFSSWVLCAEKPLDPNSPGRPRLGPIPQPLDGGI